VGFPTVLPVTSLVCFTSPSWQFLHHSDLHIQFALPPRPSRNALHSLALACLA
jgi:hypothetical protein